MHRLVTGMLCCCLASFIYACGSDKGTNSKPGLVGEWPSEATGWYELEIEIKYCENGPFGNCNWLLDWTDTVLVCSDPVVADFMRFNFVKSVTLDGISSDSLYEVVANVDYGGCQSLWSYSTEETGNPPTADGWQFLRKNLQTTCGLEEPEVDPALYRYTYTRIGDADCSGGEQ